MSGSEVYDLFIIGGGINGAGIARDAAGRGLSVCLAEQSDLASGTSSGSTKLIHGGLRYLEHYEFSLVRKALIEREVLWSIAPHIIRPLRFVLPHHTDLRPSWLIRLGLFLYDSLGGRKLLPRARSVNLAEETAGVPLKPIYKKGFEYSDCWVDDARLVILNAMDAADNGATIFTYHKVTSVSRENGIWLVELVDPNGNLHTHQSRALINVTGPWIDIVQESFDTPSKHRIRMVRGSHIVVPKIYQNDTCYIFQNADNRIVFAIPYEGDFTLVGTTDSDYEGDPAQVSITAEETDYLCQSLNQYFQKQISPGDVVWSYSAVRPLLEDGEAKAQAASRDYRIEVDDKERTAPLINIYGGKITTYRKLAEDVLDHLKPYIVVKDSTWTERSPLPGGDFPVGQDVQQIEKLISKYKFFSRQYIERLIRLYGTKAQKILGEARTVEDMGMHFGEYLSESEVRYLIEHEWATCAEDILWRRTKEGLRLMPEDVAKLEYYLQEN